MQDEVSSYLHVCQEVFRKSINWIGQPNILGKTQLTKSAFYKQLNNTITQIIHLSFIHFQEMNVLAQICI